MLSRRFGLAPSSSALTRPGPLIPNRQTERVELLNCRFGITLPSSHEYHLYIDLPLSAARRHNGRNPPPASPDLRSNIAIEPVFGSHAVQVNRKER